MKQVPNGVVARVKRHPRIMRTFPVLLMPLVLSAVAATPRVQRDPAYTEPRNERQILDVYAPPDGRERPVVLWMHGGGWQHSDKSNVGMKAQGPLKKGYPRAWPSGGLRRRHSLGR
jgi:acetyl esterase/lipase